MGCKLCTLQSNQGGEYLLSNFDQYLEAHGIQCQLTTAYILCQNNIGGRKKCTLLNATWCLLHESKLLKPYWREAINCAMYLQNRCPTKAIPPNTMPFELWHKRKSNLAHLCVFGTPKFVKIPNLLWIKIDNKMYECIFWIIVPLAKTTKINKPTME